MYKCFLLCCKCYIFKVLVSQKWLVDQAEQVSHSKIGVWIPLLSSHTRLTLIAVHVECTALQVLPQIHECQGGDHKGSSLGLHALAVNCLLNSISVNLVLGYPYLVLIPEGS